MQSIIKVFTDFALETGFAAFFTQPGAWKYAVMIVVACFLLYLAIVKKFEPLLLLPIAFGMLLTNLPGAGLYNAEIFSGGHVNWQMLTQKGGLIDYLYLGVKLGIYPSLIFLGVGAMTDFGPLIANPKSLLLGAAAQLGIFVAYLGARLIFGFDDNLAASIGIIGAADGPTAIFMANFLKSNYLGAIMVAAYSYMALVPIVQPAIVKMCTTKKERRIKMKYHAAQVSKLTRILFPVLVTIISGLIAPASLSLVGMLMFGNLLRECGVLNTLSDTAQNTLSNIITLLLGITIAFQMQAEQFVTWETLMIMGLGLFAFVFDTIGGVMCAKLMNLFCKEKINPMIGAAGISAFPMAARVVEKMGIKEDSTNHLLMHAVGANVSGQIASAIVGGLIISFVTPFL